MLIDGGIVVLGLVLVECVFWTKVIEMEPITYSSFRTVSEVDLREDFTPVNDYNTSFADIVWSALSTTTIFLIIIFMVTCIRVVIMGMHCLLSLSSLVLYEIIVPKLLLLRIVFKESSSLSFKCSTVFISSVCIQTSYDHRSKWLLLNNAKFYFNNVGVFIFKKLMRNYPS